MSENLKRVKPLFEKEDAVIRSSFKKTLIATDIHGDFAALEFILEFAEMKNVDSYIFLGDYIDKGQRSVDVLNTLFELKCKLPTNTILLRGNHETRELSTWLEFSEDLAYHPKTLDDANSVFESMPIAAVLNDKIFCVHGCISGNKEETLDDISKKNTMKYLWNDPGAENGLSPSVRGSGIYSVGPDVVENFLEKNNLKVIIRGHTSHTCGTKRWFDGKLISLYSMIHYDSPEIRAAVAIAKEDEIKFYYFRKTASGFEWEDKKKKLKLK
ncbi:MAG: metallophosphoesterase [Methanosarcinales archaeon]|nr:metallophosphoesterase [Methanosarcinales archaeon]